MKKSLLASVAAAALIAGPAFAQRQEAPPSRTEMPSRAPEAIHNAPAEKSAPSRSMDKRPAKSDTTGQAVPSGRPSADDTKSPAKSGTNGQASPSGRTSGDSDIKAAPGTRSGSETRSGPNADTRPGATTDTKPRSPGSGAAQAPGAPGKAGGSVALTTEQRSKIRASVLTANAPRVSNITFSLNVGTVVPRSVRLVAVPVTLLEIHPAWRGYMYFVYEDQIVIVEPGTLRIITIIEV